MINFLHLNGDRLFILLTHSMHDNALINVLYKYYDKIVFLWKSPINFSNCFCFRQITGEYSKRKVMLLKAQNKHMKNKLPLYKLIYNHKQYVLLFLPFPVYILLNYLSELSPEHLYIRFCLKVSCNSVLSNGRFIFHLLRAKETKNALGVNGAPGIRFF